MTSRCKEARIRILPKARSPAAAIDKCPTGRPLPEENHTWQKALRSDLQGHHLFLPRGHPGISSPVGTDFHAV